MHTNPHTFHHRKPSIPHAPIQLRASNQPRAACSSRLILKHVTCALAIFTASCSSIPDHNDPRDLSGLRAAEQKLDRNQPVSADRQPAAVIADEPVAWQELRAALGEAAGGAVIEELTLDRTLRRELADRNLTITSAEITQERELFDDQLRRTAASNSALEQSPKLLAQLQRARGLGPARYKALLERNATLRKLTRNTITLDEPTIARELDARYGPRVRCRIIVTGTEKEAARIHARIAEPAPELTQRFAAQAKALSLDPSASSGGLLEPISALDQSYAVVVRNTLKDLKPGQLSPIIVLDNGYAILLGEGEVLAQTPPPSARAYIESELRLRQERLAMDRLAQRLLNSAQVTVFDPALAWSWQNRATPSETN